MTETELALLQHDVKQIQDELATYRELQQTVVMLKQSVELLNKAIWGVAATVGSALIVITLNSIF